MVPPAPKLCKMGENNAETSPANSIFSKRIYNLLDLRLENDKDTLEALKELSTFFPANTSENRRNLRSVIEKKTVEITSEFLSSLKKVRSTLDDIYKDVTEMNTAVTQMRTQLLTTKTKTRTLIDQTTKLQKDVKDTSTKHQIASSFIKKFQLSSSEMSALRSSTVTPETFTALEKTEEIMQNCKILIQAGCQTAAQDIMEQMTLYQESGLERLLRWTQNRCRTVESPDPYGLLPQAMAKLQYRPPLFNQVLEEYTTNRRNILVRQFIDALTSGGRPIELRATEPKRYVGDMLAWLHQAVPAERDNLNFLLRNCDVIDVVETVQQALGSINEGVCHPLKVRIEHILLGENNVKDCILVQGVFNLLNYYRNIIFQVVGSGQLDSTLRESVEIAEKTFFMSLQNRVSVLLGTEVESPPADLLPTPAVNKVLLLLEQLLSSDNAAEDKQNHFGMIVSVVIDPLIMHVTESASALSTADMSVYLLNNFHFIETSLALYPFLDDRLERLKAQCDAQMDTLTSEQASRLVSQLGLGQIYTVLQGNPQKPLSSQTPVMDALNISSFVLKLEKLLKTPDLHQMPQLNLLASTNQRLAIQKRSGAVIAAIYSDLFAAVNDPENLYQNPSQLLPISPDLVTQSLTS